MKQSWNYYFICLLFRGGE